MFMVPQTLNFSPLLACLNSRNTNTNIHTNSSVIQEADEVASYYCITLTRCCTTLHDAFRHGAHPTPEVKLRAERLLLSSPGGSLGFVGT